MAKKRTPAPPDRSAITTERFVRLWRLLNLLNEEPKTRVELTRLLKIDVRGLYRDLLVLRESDISVTVAKGRYALGDKIKDALARLPFPNPLLTLGEARLLAKGRSTAHRRLAEQLDQLTA